METKYVGYRWKILGMTYTCMLSFAVVFQSIPPLLSWIIMELRISHAQAGLLMSLFALPGLFLAIPTGVISDRFGVKKVAIASLSLMVVGTLVIGASNGFLITCIGRTVSGIGAVTLSIMLPQLLSKWFLGKELGISMGVFNTAMPLGTITSFNVLGVIGKSFGWRTSIYLTTLISAFAFLMFLRYFKEPIRRTSTTKNNITASIRGLGASIWMIGLAWMWFNATFISFLTFAPDFFVSKGYEKTFASFMSSIVIIGPLFVNPLIGCILHKFGKEEVLISIGGVALAVLLALVPSTSFDVPILILIAVTSAFTPASIFSLPSKVVMPKDLGLGFGILSMCANMGMLVGPYLAGLTRDLTNEYFPSFYLAAPPLCFFTS